MICELKIDYTCIKILEYIIIKFIKKKIMLIACKIMKFYNFNVII